MKERCFNCKNINKCGIFKQSAKDTTEERAYDGWCIDYERNMKDFPDDSKENDEIILKELLSTVSEEKMFELGWIKRC